MNEDIVVADSGVVMGRICTRRSGDLGNSDIGQLPMAGFSKRIDTRDLSGTKGFP